MALNSNNREFSENFPSHVRDLIAWVTNSDLLEGHPFGRLKAQPISDTSPEIWMLGTSNYGAQLAAYLGIPYCYAYFITEGQGIEESIKNYKENFKPSKFLNKPKVNVCLWALASDDDEKAEYLFSSRAYWKIARNYGELDTLKSPKDALSKLNENNWMSEFKNMISSSIVGSSETVKNKINSIKDNNDFDELTILTWCHDEKERINSYKIFSELINYNEFMYVYLFKKYQVFINFFNCYTIKWLFEY